MKLTVDGRFLCAPWLLGLLRLGTGSWGTNTEIRYPSRQYLPVIKNKLWEDNARLRQNTYHHHNFSGTKHLRVILHVTMIIFYCHKFKSTCLHC